MTREVVTFGSATVDIFARTEEERVVELCRGDECEDLIAYPSGEKILIGEPQVEIGGGGTNTAAVFARLGISVAYGGCLGRDEHGRDVEEWLSAAGVEFVGTRVDTKTNTSIILDSHKLHDRTILAYKGASDMLRFEDLRLEALDATWYYFSSLLKQSYEAMLKLMRRANERGVAVAFNPSNYQAQHGLDALREPLERSQLFVCNKGEAELLVGEGSRKEACLRLREQGGEIVLVTDGGKGASLLYGQTLYDAAPREDVEVVETTGAGDCFASSFVAGLILGLSPEAAFRLAFVNVESLVGTVGAKKGLLGREEALRRLEADSRPVEQQNL